ncbi:hypothetical protein FO440_08080 [Mucilaginibacter corticis]|uniref:Uracil-DNA glycosylase-like domain-containing protein n=1 Tax=Mucilaginibacter corticis TaxID=2597670 RepID=A0A556MW13_9SPHI|nr:uracil-DNA glycosylase family protein [Mucilaginibacter corticis]TSJ44120.1 hypothetical protein FO440_08080 [Mucilaginibacter corticis]
MDFCNFNEKTFQRLTDALHLTFSFDRSLLLTPYLFFKGCSDDPNAHISYKTPYLLRKDIQPNTSDQDFLNKYNDATYCLGIDLPIFISKTNNNKNAIIVAEDPLRNPLDPLISEARQHALLGTPFASHLDACRKSLKEYWDFHETLLNNDFNVYITDINKILLKKDNAIKEAFPQDLLMHFKSTLQSEIDLINPSVIIVYGKKASQALANMDIKTNGKIIEFLHPSKTANGAWKKLFSSHYPNLLMNCSAANKVAYMANKVMSI